MDNLNTEKEHIPPVSPQLRGEAMSYAVQSAVYNLGANFFEPYINYRVQKHYSQNNFTHPDAGSYKQNLVGEFVGDIAGSSTLILAEALCPEQLHSMTRKIRSWVDPVYVSVAHKIFSADKDHPDYEQKIKEWTTFQERNLVRSAIIATAGIAGNIATQKLLLGNPAPTKLILAGKLISTTLTTSIGLTTRIAFPEQIQSVDNWMSKNIFAPLMKEKDQNVINSNLSTPSTTPTPPTTSTTHVEKLAQRNDKLGIDNRTKSII